MLQHGPLLERLLAGDFICQVSDEDAFRHLSNEQTQQDINHYLRPLNRRLVSNDDNSVYFLAYHELNKAAREQLSGQFALTVQSLLPLLEWLQLVQEQLAPQLQELELQRLEQPQEPVRQRQHLHQLPQEPRQRLQSRLLEP